MKTKIFFFAILLISLFAISCSIQKRHYRPGFFVQRNAAFPGFTTDRPVKKVQDKSAQQADSIYTPAIAEKQTEVTETITSPQKLRPDQRYFIHAAEKAAVCYRSQHRIKKQNGFLRTATDDGKYSNRRKVLFALSLVSLLLAIFLLFSGETAVLTGMGFLLLILGLMLLLAAIAKEKARKKEPVIPKDQEAENPEILKKKKRKIWILPMTVVPLFLLVLFLLTLGSGWSVQVMFYLLLGAFGFFLLFLFLVLMGQMELQLSKDKIKKQRDSGSGK